MKRLGIAILWLTATVCGGILLTPQGNVAVYNGLIGVRSPAGGGPTYLALQWTNKAYIVFPTNSAYSFYNKPSSFMCWFKRNYQAGYGNQVLSWGSPACWFALQFQNSDGRLMFESLRDGSWLDFVCAGPTGWTNSEWHHVGFTHDTTVARLYIDGVLVDQKTQQTGNEFQGWETFVFGGYAANNNDAEGQYSDPLTEGTYCDMRWYTNTVSSNSMYSMAAGTRGDDGNTTGCIIRIKGVFGFNNGDSIPDSTTLTNIGSASGMNGLLRRTGCKAVTW